MELVLTICAHPVTLAPTADAKTLPRHTKVRTMCVDVPLTLYGEKEWGRIIKALRIGKTALLRKDANQQILTLSFMHCLDPERDYGEEDDPNNYEFKPINGTGSAQMKLTPAIIQTIESHHDDVVNGLIDMDPDEKRKDLALFEARYNKILDQLELHKTLGGLKATLTSIAEGDIEALENSVAAAAADRPRTRSGASPAKPKPPTKTELAKKKRQIQSRIDGYLDAITKLLSSPTADTAEGDAVNAAAFAAVRKTIKDFSAYLTDGLEHVAEKWAEKCLVRLGEVELGLLTKLRIELESLLRDWCSTVLDLPALVKCGYATQPLDERSVPVTAPSEDVETEDAAAAAENDEVVEQDEKEMVAGNLDDDNGDMPVADDDDDDDDDEATVSKPMFDDVDSDVEMGVHIGDDEDAEEEESDIDESQPLLTQAPPGLDHHQASSSSEEEEEETKGSKGDVQVTPSRLTRRAADFKNKSLSNVITESAVAAVAAKRSSSKKPVASADSGRKAPATANRRRKGSSGKTPVRRSPPPRGVQNDSDLDYKGSPDRKSTQAQATKEDSSSASDDSDDNDKKPKAAPPAGNKRPRLRYNDSGDEESTDEDVAPRQRKKSRKSTTTASASSSAAKKTPRGGTGATSKTPKRTPRLTGTKLCTSSSSSEYEDSSAGRDDSSSSDDEDIPSPAAKSKAVSSPVPRIQPQSTRGVNVPRSGGKKRKRWTDEEKEAVRQGIAQYGVGRWALIKSDWAMELRDRTSVQIKDCYRTMLKRGELSEYDSDSD